MSMTCSHYMYVDVKRNGTWERAGAIFTNPDYRPDWSIDGRNSPKHNYYTWREEEEFSSFLPTILTRIGRPMDTGGGWFFDADIVNIPELVGDDGSGYFSLYWIALNALLSFNWDRPSGIYNVFMEEETYKEAVGRDFWKFVKEMKELGDPKDVRILYALYES